MITYDCGTYTLPSGKAVRVFANVTISIGAQGTVQAGERGVFMDDCLPLALSRLREQLAHVELICRGWREVDGPPPDEGTEE